MPRPTVSTLRRHLTGLFCLLALLPAALSASWWNGEWTQRRLITLDTTSAGVPIGQNVGGAVVLVRLSDANFQFALAQADGSDLRFVAEDDKTVLPYHLEKFDSLLNEAIVWVKAPEVKGSAKTTFWLYYANSGGKVEKAEDAKGTYDSSTALVYHFNERGQPANDYTMGGNNAQTAGLASEGAMIGPGLRVDGRTTVTIPASAPLFWSEGTALTWSAWVKFGPPQPHAVLFSRREAGKFFLIGADNGVPFVELSYQGGTVRTSAGAAVAAGGWHHLAVTASGERIQLYLDGEPYASARAALPALSGPSVVGGDGVGGLMNSGGGVFLGEIDELQIAHAERSAAAIKFAASSQGGEAAGRFITYGEDEQHASWYGFLKEGYVGVIISSLTFDGWLVIGILFVMSVISWWVMIRKAVYLNGIGKGNERFLADWSHVANDLSVLDAEDAEHARSLGGRSDTAGRQAMKNSSLYRIYHIGVEEIRHRLAAGGTNGGAKVLTARSMEAIKASLDGGLVRETQKMNAQMVLLTIAISGGPFLGLLGTVVGVMITFAAVAQAGDVNVNAIAPGIAAALAATVAGLAVAIPALFGYNYLLTRIKSASTDMHVFIDEFVTKLAEFYSDEIALLPPEETGSYTSKQ